MPLKDGSTVSDPRLGRLRQFDERSRAFPIKAVLPTKAPRSYTWSVGTILDQGNEGACVGFSFAHELIARPKVVPGIDAKFAKESIYWKAQQIDEWEGGSYRGAFPYYEGTSVLAGVKTLMKAGYYSSYRWAFSLSEMILAVGYSGPVVIGVDWHEGMLDTDSNGWIHATGEAVGGHAILVNCVNIAGSYFKLVNSWGPSWGTNGSCKISFADMQKLLKAQGEVCCVQRV